jgi:hypothetical protein
VVRYHSGKDWRWEITRLRETELAWRNRVKKSAETFGAEAYVWVLEKNVRK